MSILGRLATLTLAMVAVLAISVGMAGRAEAHVDLVSSSPDQGTTQMQVVEVIDLVFSTEAVPVGEGVVLVDGSQIPIPAAVTQPTPTTVRIVPNEPLQDGVFGVAWTMKAGDAHPRTGSVTFRVAVAASGGTEAEQDAPSPDAAEPLPDLDLIDEPNTAAADWVARIGRILWMLGGLMGIGAFTFAATSLIGTRREVLEAAFWVRRGGVLVIVGTLIEVGGAAMGLSAVSGFARALPDTVTGAFAISVLLRIVGGAAMIYGTSLTTRRTDAPAVDVTRIPVPRLVGGGVATVTREPERTTIGHRLDIHSDALALAGLVAVAASFMFDGHTATAEPSLVVRSASAVHVVAAGVWFGGVTLLGRILLRRRRNGEALRAAPMVLRFSVVASVALAAVGVAGLALAWSILEAPFELWSTSWGRLLLVKVTMVGLAASLGAYNHFFVVPVLESDASNEGASEQVAKVVRIEGAILIAVVVITAILVGAAS